MESGTCPISIHVKSCIVPIKVKYIIAKNPLTMSKFLAEYLPAIQPTIIINGTSSPAQRLAIIPTFRSSSPSVPVTYNGMLRLYINIAICKKINAINGKKIYMFFIPTICIVNLKIGPKLPTL